MKTEIEQLIQSGSATYQDFAMAVGELAINGQDLPGSVALFLDMLDEGTYIGLGEFYQEAMQALDDTALAQVLSTLKG